MNKQIKSKIKKYIVYLIILVIAYYLVDTLAFTKKSRSKEEIVSENIISLEKSADELSSLLTDDKEAINDFFFNDQTREKLTGLLKTYVSDRQLKINDDLKITLKQEDNPILVTYKENEFEIINTKIRSGADDSDNMAIVHDVIVVKNPDEINNYKLIHDLKTYLVDTYKQDTFNDYLDGIIAETIAENNELIDDLKQGKDE